MTAPDVIAFPLPRLLCDVGGTHIRFAAVEAEGLAPSLLSHGILASFAGFEDAARHAIASMNTPPASLLICAAGPVDGRSAQLTNRGWRLDGEVLAGSLHLKQGVLLNDFEAVALSLPALNGSSLVQVVGREQSSSSGGPQLVLGAGTGLGLAALISDDGRHQAISSEAGHITLGPACEEDEAVFARVERPHGRLTAETLISGPGLERLHRARLILSGKEPAIEMSAAGIAENAGRYSSGVEAATVRHFWRIVARFASDMALVFAARGGVVLAGGALQKLYPMMDPQEFRACFLDKSPMQALIRGISVHMLKDEYAVLKGLARIAALPSEYSIDYESRRWA